ncbi:MAG: NuoM family protein [Nitrospira sp.]|nr:NuoM family protein [Nitrospira sp.]
MTDLLTDHLLSWMIATPFLGIVALAFVRDREWMYRTALAASLLDVVFAIMLWAGFDFANPGMQFVDRTSQLPTFHIQYAVGVDGISILLVLLTVLLCPMCIVGSWRSIPTRPKAFLQLILLVEGAMLLVFSALDLFLFFMVWETITIPTYFLIMIWGGPGRFAAGLKFVLYNLTGGLLLLIAILGLYLEGGQTFDMLALADQSYSSSTQIWFFAAFFLALAIKLPLPPFHSWIPEAYAEAPAAGSALLTGILLKMGGYGLLRFCLSMFPDAAATFAPIIIWWAVLSILYAGALALAQSDLKTLIAYSSISHMGFVILGVFVFNSQGLQGAILQMFNHGVTMGALFLAVGQLYDRTHSRAIRDYGGLHLTMPRFTALWLLFVIASFGLPGTSTFVGEFLVLVGAADDHLAAVLPAMGGVVLAAVYMLWMVQRVVLGQPQTAAASRLQDVGMREMATLVPLAVLIFWVGLYPDPWMAMTEASVTQLIQHLTGGPVISLLQPVLQP